MSETCPHPDMWWGLFLFELLFTKSKKNGLKMETLKEKAKRLADFYSIEYTEHLPTKEQFDALLQKLSEYEERQKTFGLQTLLSMEREERLQHQVIALKMQLQEKDDFISKLVKQ
jgi:hypothetical protein